MKWYVGIDPGLDGALVIVDTNRNIQNHIKIPYHTVGTKRKIDINGLIDYLNSLTGRYEEIFVTLEQVHAMPGQGVTSMFSMGYGYGVICATLAALTLPHQLVTPQKWQKELLAGIPKGKDASVVVALRLFPEAHKILIGPRGGRDHNIADALLIAEWARKQDFKTLQS